MCFCSLYYTAALIRRLGAGGFDGYDLPVAGLYDTTVIWSSDNKTVIGDGGVLLSRPAQGEGDAAVRLTATVSLNGISDTVVFDLVVQEKREPIWIYPNPNGNLGTVDK